MNLALVTGWHYAECPACINTEPLAAIKTNMRIVIPLLIFLLLTLTILGQTTKECPSDKFYGGWIFINYYKGKLTDIKPLSKETFKSEWGTPVLTYNENGNYVNDQGDYKTKGKFILDSAKCIIKEFDDNGSKDDNTLFQIMYLDKDYLLITKLEENPYSYFYKRK